MIYINTCPVCNNDSFTSKFAAVDYTVTGESFNIVSCDSCKFLFTNPRPADEVLGRYYKSEDYISHTDTSEGLINKLYKFVRKITLNSKLKLIKSFNGGKVLDIGSGTGAFVNHLNLAGLNVMGVEPDPDAREQAKKIYNIELSPEQHLLDMPDKSYSIITMWHVLEHVSHLNDRVAELFRLTKDDGTIIIAVPNHQSLDARFYNQFWAAYDVPRHLYHFDKQSIRLLFEKHNLYLSQVLPMHFDAFYVSMLSEKYKGSAFGTLRAFFTGLKTFLFGGNENSSSLIYIFKKKTH
jgi:2-polyprenyl-3-methyl-5-hydroxy-6-metoxy-1,4-benzoquinol methylase